MVDAGGLLGTTPRVRLGENGSHWIRWTSLKFPVSQSVSQSGVDRLSSAFFLSLRFAGKRKRKKKLMITDRRLISRPESQDPWYGAVRESTHRILPPSFFLAGRC